MRGRIGGKTSQAIAGSVRSNADLPSSEDRRCIARRNGEHSPEIRFFSFTMDCPIQLVAPLIGVCVLTSSGMLAAKDSAPASRRERAISPRVAEIFSAVAPKFEPSATVGREGEVAMPNPGSAPRPKVEPGANPARANTIIRLPEYLVQERKPRPLPKPEEIMSPRELEKLAMQEFLGPEDGFDRGFLNLFTVADLWKKIPLLGKFPLAVFETNEERAMRMYRADREAKAWAEAMSLLSPMQRAGIATPTGSAPQPIK
jgi:hypothetical protein